MYAQHRWRPKSAVRRCFWVGETILSGLDGGVRTRTSRTPMIIANALLAPILINWPLSLARDVVDDVNAVTAGS